MKLSAFFAVTACVVLSGCNQAEPDAEVIRTHLLSASGKDWVGNDRSIKRWMSDLEISNVKCEGELKKGFIKLPREKREDAYLWTCFYDITGGTFKDGKVPSVRQVRIDSTPRVMAIVTNLIVGNTARLKDRKIKLYLYEDKWREA